MSSILPGFEYDIFISYRHNDNLDGWVTDFVQNLERELKATLKDSLTIYFDKNPHDGLLETHHVDKSLEGKLKCLIFIPIISQTYCDLKSFAWQHEFCAFNKIAKEDQFGRDIKLGNGNVASRILPIKIHDLDADDKGLLENEMGGALRAVDFIYKETGVNRPLKADDKEERNLNGTKYRNQVNKVANAVKELIVGLRDFGSKSKVTPNELFIEPQTNRQDQSGTANFWRQLKKRNIIKVATVYAISGWVIMQIASTVFPPLNIPAWALTFLIVFILLGFPIALILTWAYEMSPDGSVRSITSVLEESEKKPFNYKPVISFLLVVIIGAFTYYRFYKNSSFAPTKGSNAETSASEKSIAVLPFENLTNDTELEAFCDGVNEEILNHLSKLGSLSVTSRTSVKVFKGTKLSAIEIGEKLGVNHLLEGSVRKSGEKVRITVQLIDATTDKHLWSEDYDYSELKDIFPVQTDVSTRVTEVLKLKLTPQEKESFSKKYTDNIQAYKLYRRGRNFWEKRSKESYDSAEVCYKRAIELDPDYALAYSGLADCYTFNTKGLSQLEAVPIANAYALKALQIDSTLCEALTTLGFIQSHFNYQWEEGKKTLRKAILCNPNYTIAHLYLGNISIFNGDKEGMKEIKKALELDPLSPTINWVMGRSYYSLHQYDSCVRQLTKAINLNQDFALTRTTLALAYITSHKFDEARQVIDKMPETFNANLEYKGLFLGLWYASQGNAKLANIEIEKIKKKTKILPDFRIAQIQLALGNKEKVFESLENARKLHEINLLLIKDPSFDSISDDLRFKAILKKINLD